MYVFPTDVETNSLMDEHAHDHALGVDPVHYGEVLDTDSDGNQYVEMYFASRMSKCVVDDSNMGDDDVAIIQVMLAGLKKAVISRMSDLLTREELKSHEGLVNAAILEELRIWLKHNCFCRRTKARNILDSRYVAKWKVIRCAGKPDSRIIRMRMVMRGF